MQGTETIYLSVVLVRFSKNKITVMIRSSCVFCFFFFNIAFGNNDAEDVFLCEGKRRGRGFHITLPHWY